MTGSNSGFSKDNNDISMKQDETLGKGIFSVDKDTIIDVTPNSVEELSCELLAFKLKNYKAFNETEWIELNKFTLIYGNNSAGKSALYEVLLILKYCYEKNKQEDNFTNLYGIKDFVGNYNSLKYKGNNDKEVQISLRFLMSDNTIVDYVISIVSDNDSEWGRISKVQLLSDKITFDALQYYKSINIFFLSKINDSMPEGYVEFSDKEKNLIQAILSAIKLFASKFQNISAHRFIPERNILFSGEKYQTVGRNGQNAYEILYQLSQLDDVHETYVSEWLDHFGFGYRFDLKGKNTGEFLLINKKTGIESNIVDNGFGISQSFPLAVAATIAKDSIMLVDSPEAFLQTNMQSEIADLLLKVSDNNKLIIETSSNYLLLRIQRRIMENRINKDDVAVYFISEKLDKAECKKIKLKDNGKYMDAPDSFLQFFSSDYKDIEEMGKIARQMKKG